MRRLDTQLPDLVLVEQPVFSDERGFFQETYRESALSELGVDDHFVQDNHSRSARGVLRGMHYSVGAGQAKLVRCARGRIHDVAVDLRRDSPAFGRWEAFELDDANGRMLYLPIGFAHGFVVLSDVADVTYKCSSYYDGSLERGFAYDDPEVGIEWPIADPVVSDRDRAAPSFAEIREELPFTLRAAAR